VAALRLNYDRELARLSEPFFNSAGIHPARVDYRTRPGRPTPSHPSVPGPARSGWRSTTGRTVSSESIPKITEFLDLKVLVRLGMI
jgi:hypothetical protein